MLPDERMVEAAARHLNSEWAGPYMARIRDFTDEQLAAGMLAKADEEANGKARGEARRALKAAFATLDRDALIEVGLSALVAIDDERLTQPRASELRRFSEAVLRAVGLIR